MSNTSRGVMKIPTATFATRQRHQRQGRRGHRRRAVRDARRAQGRRAPRPCRRRQGRGPDEGRDRASRCGRSRCRSGHPAAIIGPCCRSHTAESVPSASPARRRSSPSRRSWPAAGRRRPNRSPSRSSPRRGDARGARSRRPDRGRARRAEGRRAGRRLGVAARGPRPGRQPRGHPAGGGRALQRDRPRRAVHAGLSLPARPPLRRPRRSRALPPRRAAHADHHRRAPPRPDAGGRGARDGDLAGWRHRPREPAALLRVLLDADVPRGRPAARHADRRAQPAPSRTPSCRSTAASGTTTSRATRCSSIPGA